MIAYIAIGGWDPEGFDINSIRTFYTRSAAQEYTKRMITVGVMENPGVIFKYQVAEVVESEIE